MVVQKPLRSYTIRIGKKISADISKLDRRDPNYAQKVRAIQSKYSFGKKDMIKAVEKEYGTRSHEFDEWGKHLSRRGKTGITLIKARERRKAKLEEIKARRKAKHDAIQAKKRVVPFLLKKINKKKKSSPPLSPSIAASTDIVSLASGFLSSAVSSAVPKTIKSGDNLLKDNFSKYNQLVKASSSELTQQGFSTKVDGHALNTNVSTTVPHSSKQLNDVLDTVSPIFAQAQDEKEIVIMKMIAGLVTAVGGDKSIAEVLSLLIQRRYPADVKNLYGAIKKEQWVSVATSLMPLLQKIWEDQDKLMPIVAVFAGQDTANQFVRRWKSQQVPFIGWTLLAANLINVIKGIIDPPTAIE